MAKSLICGYCGDKYEDDPSYTEEDRIAEYKKNFPNDPNMELKQVDICEDCYKEFKAWLNNLTPEQRELIDMEAKNEAKG